MIEYLLYRLVIALGWITPLSLAYWVAMRIADLHYYFDTSARKAVEKNMRHILGPGTPDSVVDNEVRWTFRHFGKYMAEFFRYTRFNSKYVERYVLINGMKNLKEAMARGKGCIMVTAHIGNWEMGACCMKSLGYDVTSVAMDVRNRKVNALLNRQRTRRGVNVIPVGGFLRGCYRALRTGQTVALLGDRDLTSSGIKISFFDSEVSFPKGPARLSVRTGAPVVPCFFLRRANDCWQMTFGDPIYPASVSDSDDAVKPIMERCVSAMEQVIREHPAQWAMFHDIWDEDND